MSNVKISKYTNVERQKMSKCKNVENTKIFAETFDIFCIKCFLKILVAKIELRFLFVIKRTQERQ